MELDMNDEIFYLDATKEFESNNIDDALWAKLVAVNLGDEVKAKYEYIQIRAGRLAAQTYVEPSAATIVGVNTVSKTVKVRVQEYALNHNLTEGHAVDLIRGNNLKGIREEGEWYVLVEPDTLGDPDENVEATPGFSFQSEFMLLTEFAKIKGIDEKKVISMIRDGFYVGRKQNDTWYVSRTELGNNPGEQANTKKPEPNIKNSRSYIPVSEFAHAKGLTEPKVVQMIRDGFFDGKLIDGAWSVNSSELKEDRGNSNEIGFFEKLLNGDFSLPIHYWLFTVVGNMVLKLLFLGFESARNYYGAMFVLVMVIVYNIPILVGLWRAAVKYKGSSIWKVLVQILCVLGGVGVIGNTIILLKSI